jgi:hypothetical protein
MLRVSLTPVFQNSQLLEDFEDFFDSLLEKIIELKQMQILVPLACVMVGFELCKAMTAHNIIHVHNVSYEHIKTTHFTGLKSEMTSLVSS